MPRSRPIHQRQDEALRLVRLRVTLGLTQRELAAEFQVAHGAIAAWESGKQTLPGPVLKLLDLYEEELGIGDQDRGFTRLKTSAIARSAALSGAAASIFIQGAASWIERLISSDDHHNAITRRAHAAIARNIVSTLGDLKGVAMKVGQTLGYLDYALPEESRAELATLQKSSRHMAPAVVTEVFLEEFGETPRQLFAEWTPTPFVAASIGQVHRARLRTGEEVVVKVQYPAVVDAIKNDLRSATVVDRLCRLLFRGQDRGTFIAEIRERFLEECDYLHEAANQEEFRSLWAGTPGIRIPKVHHSLTRRRVLVSAFEQGESLDCFLKYASAEARSRAGAALWQFSFESIFRHGMFHADPHAGNFLFAGDDLVVLDFGCVKRFPPNLLSKWRQLLRAALERRRSEAQTLLREFGVAPDLTRYDFDYHLNMVLRFFEPWLHDGGFRFTSEFARKAWQLAMVKNPNKFRSNVPKDFFFADRLHFGLHSLLARLEPVVDFRRRILDLLYEPGERRPEAFSAYEIAMLAG